MVNFKLFLSPRQCEAARGWLRWTRADLSKASTIAESTIARFEAGSFVMIDRTLRDIQQAFENEGLEFIFEDRKGVGVKIRKHPQV